MAIVLCKIKNPKPATQGWVGVLPGGKARRYMCRHRMAGPVGHIVICTDTAKHPAQRTRTIHNCRNIKYTFIYLVMELVVNSAVIDLITRLTSLITGSYAITSVEYQPHSRRL